MADAVGVAAAEGDRSENAEYIYGKMKLGQIHGKLRHVGNRLKAVTVVPQPPPDDGCVHFGCWVRLEDDDTGDELTYRIVGPDETNTERGWISAESPMALALLGKELDDEVTVRRPKGDLNATIVGVFVSEP